MSVTNHARILEGVCAGEVRAIIKEKGKIASVRAEAQQFRLFCVDMVCM